MGGVVQVQNRWVWYVVQRPRGIREFAEISVSI